jgi:hypothetical protein
VNNYACGLHRDGEVFIQTTPAQLEATAGRVFLTVVELRHLLALAEGKGEGGAS